MSHLAPLYTDHLRALRRRADAALEATGFDALAIHAGSAHMQFLDDQPYPFKINPHFKWWVPLPDAEACWVLYRPGTKPKLIFFQPVDYWHKPPALPTDDWISHFSVDVIRQPAEARAHLGELKNCAFVGEWQDSFNDWGFGAHNPATLIERLHYERAIKTRYELECMRRASARAARAHRAAEQAFRGGASEYHIHLAYLEAAGHTEAELPYPNIVALNSNAAVLHYQHQERQAPLQRHSFLIDAGAQVNGYASDVTRTYTAEPDDFTHLIDGMHQLQQELCKAVRSGTPYANLHLDAHLRIANLLREAEITTVGGPEAVQSGLSSVFFPHGVGHLLGLQVHDVGGFATSIEGEQRARPEGHPHLRLTRTLEPGVVVTIEPGVYFIDALLDQARQSKHASTIQWTRVEQFKPYGGIRIEDNVACTKGEPENLTRKAFEAASR